MTDLEGKTPAEIRAQLHSPAPQGGVRDADDTGDEETPLSERTPAEVRAIVRGKEVRDGEDT